MNNKKNKTVFTSVVVVVILLAAVIIGVVSLISSNSGDRHKSIDQLLSKIKVKEATPVKASVSLDNASLYDELPEIDKYPLVVNGSGDINLEIFSSGEKANKEKNYETWLIDVAEKFNDEGFMDSNGNTLSVSVRQVSSGMGADYIISGKYIPDLWTPSSYLFGEYVNSQGGNVTEYCDRLIGNTAGILVDKSKGYKSVNDVINAVKKNELNFGYTNPQSSATGANLLLYLLKSSDSNMFSDSAIESFSEFQKNIPYVAMTTMQMRDSASNGSLDGMVMEYQTYTNVKELNSIYDFIPFGIRHDNPLYMTSKGQNKADVVYKFYEFCMSDENQKLATQKGFNANDDYKSEYEFSGSELSKALEIYKKNKDSGKDVIAVFVADCSGSMNGEPILQLKESLTNGARYINDNNLVGLVSYDDNVTIELPIAKFDLNQRAYFQGAVEGLSAGGGTASYDACVVAIDMIKKAQEQNPDAKVLLFLLSDGMVTSGYSLNKVEGALKDEGIPVYTISYTSEADTESMKALASINEAASINADSDDVIYQIKSLFNAQM